MINNEKIINEFRSFMNKEKIDFFVINATDEYLNEYIDLNINPRYFLTGFSGSTGDALVTKEDVFLFVDGRYHLQADDETDKKLVTVVKVGMDSFPQQMLINKIVELSQNNSTLGLLSSKLSCNYFRKIVENLKDKNINFKEFSNDPVLEIAGSTENIINKPLRFVSESISGESPESKLEFINNKLKKLDVNVLLITKLEEIAYITNLRGNEISYNSGYRAKAIVEKNKCTIFCDINNLSPDLVEKLGPKFDFKNNKCFESYINNFKSSKCVKIAFDMAFTNLYTYRILENAACQLVEIEESPIAQMKSIKNQSELTHIQECFLKTDIVVNKAIFWLNQELANSIKVSEKDFSNKVKDLFYKEGACALSFEVLAASGKNTAIIHYTHPNPEKIINPEDLILLDCGAYFEGGYATDITRTFLAGGKNTVAGDKEKEIYTKVLKAFLNALYHSVNKETTGFDIDKKARDVLSVDIEEGFNFAHGTGHGVGISVHESPPRLGPAESSKAKLLPGMVFTIEPGLYNNNWGGVRLENTVNLVEKDGKLKIEPLGKCTFDENLIDLKYLTDQEISWLKDYQAKSISLNNL